MSDADAIRSRITRWKELHDGIVDIECDLIQFRKNGWSVVGQNEEQLLARCKPLLEEFSLISKTVADDCDVHGLDGRTLRHLANTPLSDALRDDAQALLDGLTARLMTHIGIREKSRRRTHKRKPTVRQLEALTVVPNCNMNFAEAARQMGVRDAKTVRQHWKAGLKKMDLQESAYTKAKSTAMPRDHRGQEDIAGEDDGPAAKGPRPQVRRQKRG